MTFSTDTARRRYASLADAAAYVDCNERTLRRHIAAGRLHGYRLGKLVRVDLTELDALMKPIPTADSVHPLPPRDKIA
jgi:excisionase family DNA binding protein